MKPLFRVLAYLLFYGWNLWFLAWIGLGLGPTVLFTMAVAVGSGMVPASFAEFGAVLALTPVIGLLASLHPRLRGDPGRLLSMFYGVQAPVMLLCTVRLFAIHQIGWPVGLALAVIAIGGASLVRTLLVGPEERSTWAQVARLVAQAGYLLVGWWWALLVGLYAATCTQLALRGLWEAGWNFARHPAWITPAIALTAGTFGMLALLSALVLAFFPIAMVGISSRAFQLVARATAARVGWGPTAAIGAATVLGWVLALGLAGRQPQGFAFAALEAAKDDAGRKAAIAQSDRIRDGLVFADLAWARTFDADPEGRHVVDLWEPLVGEALAEGPRRLWVALTWPFVYHPYAAGFVWGGERDWGFEAQRDQGQAPLAYAEFFDAPIEVAERETLVAAARATWNWEDARAGLLEVGQQKVHLQRQELTVEPRGDVAEVTVHDVYRNRTWDRQEVLVHFSLPESAAITGLWLGTDPDRSHAFAYTVAPRGAAQQIYEEEVHQRRDPALLEEVGPRQYRLRAFPVEPREGTPTDVTSITAEGPELHLWLTVTVALQEEDGAGYFPLPRASEVRNLFWDGATERVGEESVDAWLPDRVAAENTVRRDHRVTLSGWTVEATPASAAGGRRLDRLTVLVDGTRSMERHRDEVAASLDRLSHAANLDVLCTREQVLVRCLDFDPATALFWGSTALETRLVEAAPIAAGPLVVLTDSGSYPLAAAAEAAGLPDLTLPPLWLVHLGGDPTAYPDWTLDRIQRTGGGVGSSVDEVLARIADPAVVGGWRWRFTPSDGPDSPADSFAPVAARALVAHLDQLHRSGQLASLDQLHALAVGHHVITPYSSMIVLVDEAQRQRLADAAARADRFDREVIDSPTAPVEVSSAPEPGTLVLLGVGGLGVLAAGRRRRAGAHPRPS